MCETWVDPDPRHVERSMPPKVGDILMVEGQRCRVTAVRPDNPNLDQRHPAPDWSAYTVDLEPVGREDIDRWVAPDV